MNTYLVSIIALSGTAVIGAIGLNIITGFCGQVSVGHAAFIGVGDYVTGLMLQHGAPLWAALAAASTGACLAGLIVGLSSIRVRGDFLAITTLAVGFLFQGVVRKAPALGAAYGISGLPPSPLGPTGDMLLIVGFAGVAIAIGEYADRSWAGLVFNAIRIDEEAGRTSGIAVARYKLLAFCLGTALAGLAGGLYVNFAHIVLPDSLGFGLSVSMLAMVVVGGVGSTLGVSVGAIGLTVLPEVARVLGDYRMITYGVLLILAMLFAPRGLAGVARSIRARLS
jgi:branched-chain amino acid transport system permease protein